MNKIIIKMFALAALCIAFLPSVCKATDHEYPQNSVVIGSTVCSSVPNALNISIGFIPAKVEVYNMTTGVKAEWVQGMGDAYEVTYTTTGPVIAIVTTNGISAYTGSTGYGSAASFAAPGFTIGADSHVNVSGQTLHYIAWR